MRRVFTAAALLAMATSAAADNIEFLGSLGQDQFRKLSEDLGSALSYKAVSPAEPLGITGFDLGVEASVTTLKNDKAFEKATGATTTSLVVPKLHLTKGLPLGIDVGALYSSVPDSNIKLTGLELKYAFLEGGVATPAVALRGNWTRMDGVDQMDLQTKGLELTVSKGLAMATPYAGVGNVWVESNPDSSTGLDKESFTQTRMFVGLNFSLGLPNFAIEADKTGDATTWSAKLGFRW